MSVQNLFVEVTAAGTLQGAGPLYKVLSAEHTTELDKAGRIAITVPIDTRAEDILLNDRVLTIKTTEASFAGPLQTLTIDTQDGQAVYRLEGTDLLGELNYANTGDKAIYDNENTASVIIGNDTTLNSLLYGTSWTQGTVTIAADYTTQTIEFNSETALSALINLCNQIGHHFRPASASTRALDVFSAAAASGYRIINVDGARYGQDTTYTGIYGNIQIAQISADIENRLYPVGKDGFDLRDAPTTITDILVDGALGTYGRATDTDDTAAAGQKIIPVTATTGFAVRQEVFIGNSSDWTQAHECATIMSINAGVSITVNSNLVNTYAAGANVIQSPRFYVLDAASIAAHGQRAACPQFGWIGPGDTAADYATQQRAATTLYNAAKARLARYKDTYEQYTVSDVYNLPPALLPGQYLRLTFIGTQNGAQFAYVDGNYYTLKVTRRWAGDGVGGARGVASVELASVFRPAPNNTNLVIFNLDSNKWVGT